MADEKVRLVVNVVWDEESLRRVHEAAGRLDADSVAHPLVAARAACQQAEAGLADLIDHLPAAGPDLTRAQALRTLAALKREVDGALTLLAQQAAERAVAAYRSTGGPVDTSGPE